MTTTDDPTLAGLHRAVLAAPDDDTPRLVYADRLEESAGWAKCWQCCGLGWVLVSIPGVPQPHQICPRCSGTGRVSDGRRERAEFIRVQCELAKRRPHLECPCGQPWDGPIPLNSFPVPLSACRRRYCAGYGPMWPDVQSAERLRGRERELWAGRAGIAICQGGLLDELEPRLAPLADPAPPQCVYRRGFVDEVRLPLAGYWSLLRDQVFARHPVRRVTLLDREPNAINVWFAIVGRDFESATSPAPGTGPNWLPWRIAALLSDRHFLRRQEFPAFIRCEWQYPSRQAADEAVSAACVAFVRWDAGLQDYPEPTRGGLR